MDKPFLLRSLEQMRRHFAGAGETGPYWDAIVKRIDKQLALSEADGPWFSSDVYHATAFSGAPLNGIRDVATKLNGSTAQFLFKKVENLLIRLNFLAPLTHPVLRYVMAKQKVRTYAGLAGYGYDMLVRCGHELLKTDIEKLDIRSPDAFGVDLVDVGKRKLAHKTIADLNVYLRLKDLIPARPLTIVEIGAGVGELARIFMATGTSKKHIIADIPPTLAFSQNLISSSFPGRKMSHFAAERGPLDLDDDNLCYFLTPDQLDRLPQVDVGINIGSFGEMTRDIVQRYIGVLTSKGCREFISINQRITKGGNKDVIGEKEYAEFFGAGYKIARKASFDADRPGARLMDDEPGQPGYQLLHFIRV